MLLRALFKYGLCKAPYGNVVNDVQPPSLFLRIRTVISTLDCGLP